MKLKAICILMMVLGLSGCAGISPEQEMLGESLDAIMDEDFKIVRLASLYHARYEAWPQNVEELNNFSIDSESQTAELQLRSVTDLSTVDNHLIVELESMDPDSAKMIKRQVKITPLEQEGQYVAKYFSKGGERVKMNGTMEVNVESLE